MELSRYFLLLIVAGALMFSLSGPTVKADSTPITLLQTNPERIEPLEDVTLLLEITNTTADSMWSPKVKLIQTDENNSYFEISEEYVEANIGNKEYLNPEETAQVEVTFTVLPSCPSQRHIIQTSLMYGSGDCENGCYIEEVSSTISITVFRQDPKLAIITQGPETVSQSTPIILDITLNNLGTGIAKNIVISASSTPSLPTSSYFVGHDSPPDVDIGENIIAISELDTNNAEAGFYTIDIFACYEDKYGATLNRTSQIIVKVMGTASEEALLQATQLQEMGINAYQIKKYSTAISYFERAIEIYEKIDYQEGITFCGEYISLSTTYVQAENYYVKGDAYFQSQDYINAKMFYSLAYEKYTILENSEKLTELNSKITLCNGQIEKYAIMDWAIYLSVALCFVYGIIIKRKKIIGILNRKQISGQ